MRLSRSSPTAHPQLKFGAGAVRRDRLRPLPVRRPPGARGHRPRRRRDRPPAAGRRPDGASSASRRSVFDGVHVEPTDASLRGGDRRTPATPGPWDAFVAVGGGSSIDTAKAVNLLTTNPGELMDYINVPVGKGAGAGEAAQAAGRRADHHRHRRREHHDLRARRARPEGEDRHQPRRGCGRPWPWSTPTLTLTQPAGVTAAAGMDILCHALESYTARPLHVLRPQAARAAGALLRRPTRSRTCGRRRRCRLLAGVLPPGRAPRRRRRGARHEMALAATFAGHGLRQRRRAHPARQRLPDRRPGQGLPPRGLPGRRADGAARHGGRR